MKDTRFEFSDEKRALLEQMLRSEGIASGEQVLPRREPSAPIPLSSAQARLWLLDKFSPGNPAYLIPIVLRLEGSIDYAKFRSSVNAVIQRHEVLRTHFTMQNDAPVQVVVPKLEIDIPVIELAGSADQRNDSADEFVQEDSRKPFDLQRGPLLRITLLRLAPDVHLLSLVVHHAIAEGWSLGIFFKEVSTFYRSEVGQEAVKLPKLSIQYGDFAAWQRDRLDLDSTKAQLAYWKQQLRGNLPTLDLPCDHPRPGINGFLGSWQSQIIGKPLSSQLHALALETGNTMFVVLLAAYQVFLHRFSGQHDLLIGSAVSNRSHLELEKLIGHFVNTQVLRTQLSGNLSFRSLLARTGEVVRAAHAHQDLPFEQLLDALHVERDLQSNPLFQVAFVLQDSPHDGHWKSALNLPGVTSVAQHVHNGTAKFDLTLEVEFVDERLVASFEYNSELFEGATIGRWLASFETLLSSIVLNPDQTIGQLELLPSNEKESLKIHQQGKRVPLSQRVVSEQFEHEVARQPDALAVSAEGGRFLLTYQQLNSRANQLAHFLKQKGVGRDIPVAILLERSVETAVAILGTMKAGGAFAPLDPRTPAERINTILSDLHPPVVLTQDNLLENLSSISAHPISLDSEWSDIAKESNENPNATIRSNDLAYIIYTSGSTGRPKGVEIEHQSLSNLVAWHRDVYEVSHTDRASLLAGPAFDASVWELWPYLSCGASVHIPKDELLSIPSQLIQWFVDERITIGFCPTPLAEVLIEQQWPQPMDLTRLLTGGDRLHRAPAVPLPFDVFNNYGPTENTVVTTWSKVDCGGCSPAAPPIGRPVHNQAVYVLDGNMQPVPTGVCGELYIGGSGLARGYRNDRRLTDDRFVKNTLHSDSSHRLYKTGDFVRQLANGDLVFVGRADDQIKIRGFRIELGEIEAILASHPSVEQAVVVATKPEGDVDCLIGYYVATRDAIQEDLKSFLRQKLPEYMVPRAIVPVESIPLTGNGKVNRDALPTSLPDANTSSPSFAEPDSSTEQALTTIWRDVLKVERIGIHDNFFELGGNSLSMCKVNDRLNQLFEREVSLVDMFRHPSIKELAEFLSESSQASKHVVPGQRRAKLRRQLQKKRRGRGSDSGR